MDKPPAKPPKTGNSLLQLLTRRSTKVEPAVQPPNINAAAAAAAAVTSSSSHPLPLLVGNGTAGGRHTTTASAHASPINQFRQSYVRRHSSTQNLSTIIRDEANSPLRKPANGGIAKKSKTLNNRFSHQFTLCCSFHDDRIYTPPVSVRYNSLAQNGGGTLLASRGASASSVAPDAATSTSTTTKTTTLSPVFSGGGSSNGDGTGTSASTSTSTTVVTVHRDGVRDRDPQSSPEMAAVSRAHSAKSNNSSSTSSSAAVAGDSVTCRKSSTEPNTPAKQLLQQQPPFPHPKQSMSSPPAPIRNPRHQQFIQQTKSKSPVFDEFQASSIAMSACRSRLRQKLLPPGGSLDLPLMSSSAAAAASASGSTDVVQHFSSPNIVSGGVGARLLAHDYDDADGDSADAESAFMAATEEGIAANRSLSYDVLTGVKRPASADSLAKQSLIAAQLLNLIPAERARERCVAI